MPLEKFYDIDKKGIVRIRKWKKNGILYNSWNSFAGYSAACRGEECMPCRGGYKGDRKVPLIRIGPCSAL
jgi:hypothetical protein